MLRRPAVLGVSPPTIRFWMTTSGKLRPMASKLHSFSPAALSMMAVPRSISAREARLSREALSISESRPARYRLPAARRSLVNSSSGPVISSARVQEPGTQSNSLHRASCPSTLTASFTSVPPMSIPSSSFPAVRAGSRAKTGCPVTA